MKTLNDTIMESIAAVSEEKSFHAREIELAIEAAKKEGVDFVRCKFVDSKNVNVNIKNLTKLMELV